MKTMNTSPKPTPKPGKDAPASNTYPLSSHPVLLEPHSQTKMQIQLPPVVSVDCLYIGGAVHWDQRSLEILDAVYEKAREQRKAVPWDMANMTALVHPTGMPVGNKSWLKYRVEFAGIEIGISDRHPRGRKNSNFRLQAPGESCLMVGLSRILDFQDAVIRELGGEMVDSWLQRADFCVDLSGVSIN